MNSRKLGALGKIMGMGHHDVITYREQVAKVMGGTQKDVVFNGTLEHACIVVEQAFIAAKSHIRILTDKLDCDCYGREGVRHAMRTFLGKPGTKLDILIENADAASSIYARAFTKEAAELAGARVYVAHVPETLSRTYSFNFLIVDDVAFRFEEDRRVPVAAVAGGPDHADGVENLTRIFEAIKASSTPVGTPTRELAVA